MRPDSAVELLLPPLTHTGMPLDKTGCSPMMMPAPAASLTILAHRQCPLEVRASLRFAQSAAAAYDDIIPSELKYSLRTRRVAAMKMAGDPLLAVSITAGQLNWPGCDRVRIDDRLAP